MATNEYKYTIGYGNAVLVGLKSLLQTLSPEEQAVFLVKLANNASLTRKALLADFGSGDAIEGFDAAFKALSDLSPPQKTS